MQCRPLSVMENNEEFQGEGNQLWVDEPGDPGAPWPTMIRPHSSHNTHCWDSDSCIGCRMKIYLSPNCETLPTCKIQIFTEAFLSAKTTHRHTRKHIYMYVVRRKTREKGAESLFEIKSPTTSISCKVTLG